jgi:hypothetical protein
LPPRDCLIGHVLALSLGTPPGCPLVAHLWRFSLKGKIIKRIQASRKLGDRKHCLEVLRDSRSGEHAHYGWVDPRIVFEVLKNGENVSIAPIQEALEYLADKGYVQFLEGKDEVSDQPVVHYRIVAHGQDLLDGLIEDDPGVANF